MARGGAAALGEERVARGGAAAQVAPGATERLTPPATCQRVPLAEFSKCATTLAKFESQHAENDTVKQVRQPALLSGVLWLLAARFCARGGPA